MTARGGARRIHFLIRYGGAKRNGRRIIKEEEGITRASKKAHHVQDDTEVKGHGSFTFIVPGLSFFSPRMPSCRAVSVARPVGYTARAETTKGTARQRQERRGETNDDGELFSTEATSLPLKPRGRGLSCPHRVTHSRISLSSPPLPVPQEPPGRNNRSPRTCPATNAFHLRSTLPPPLNLFYRVACCLPLSLPLSPLVSSRRSVECANKSCTNAAEVWTRSPINYSDGAANSLRLFFACFLSLSPPSYLSLTPSFSLLRPPARPAGAWFRREIYIANLFIHLLRAFVYSCPTGRPNNGRERGASRTVACPAVTVGV